MIKTRAIVLHRFPYSDSSWIVKALAEETGTVSFIVKGGKRKDSPFKGALDPLALCEIVYRENPNTELQFLKEASVINWHAHLREDLLALAKAQVMAEIVLRYAPAGVPLEGEFSLLEEALAALDVPDIKLPAGNAPEQDAAPSLPAGIKPPANSKSGVFARWLLETCELWGYHLDMSSCSRCTTKSKALRPISIRKQARSSAKAASESKLPALGPKRSPVSRRCAPAGPSRTRNTSRTRSSPTCAATSGSCAK